MSFLSNKAAPMAAVARALMVNKGDFNGALAYAKAHHAFPEVSAVLKSAVDAGTTTDTNWASSLSEMRSISDGFLASLGEFSAFNLV
jgi:hypothetical protein